MNVTVIGNLESFAKEYRGQSQFPTAELELVNGNTTIKFKATSSTAHLLDDTLGGAPRGVVVKVFGSSSHREYNERTYMDLNAHGAIILGSMGKAGSHFEVQGFVHGVREFETNSGKVLQFAQIREMSYDRDAHVDGIVEMFMPEDHSMDTWAENVGKIATVTGRVTGKKNDRGFVNHSFHAENIIYSEVPSFWENFTDEEAAASATGATISGLF